jgi:KUP system potassium uptake protein
MVVWFGVLAVSGAVSLSGDLSVLKALNPFYGLEFLAKNGIAGFFVLSEVILCATGGEALYADMGHISRRSIRLGWAVVFIALVFNYLGQGVFALQHPEVANVFFGMLSAQSGILYVPLLLLALMATVIASQAMISGMFSVVYQGINTGILPRLKVDYTSAKFRSQIYISFVNWSLLAAVLLVMVYFGTSASLASAYGLAVTGSMTITGIMMVTIFYLRKSFVKMLAACAVTLADLTYLFACSMKIPHGGYWSLLIASVPLAFILIYYAGQKRLHRAMIPIPLGYFLRKYEAMYTSGIRIPGTALYFAKEIGAIPQYLGRVMFDNRIIYEENIIVSIAQKDEPYGISYGFDTPLATGLKHFAIEFGYMEALNVENIIRSAGISERAIFYGLEEIQTGNVLWKVFAAIKQLTPSTVRFYKLPIEKLHGVMMRVDMRVKQ